MKGRIACFTLICIVLINVKLDYVSSACAAGEYECNNGNCILSSQVNNSANDCVDNSDEGFPITCNTDQFKCTLPFTIGRNDFGQCVQQSYYLDGAYDCNDDSDEVRLVGSVCDPAGTSGGYCCNCLDDIPESECNATTGADEGTCQCQSGRYANETRTACIVRVLFDACSIDSDCYDAITNTACVSGICVCDHGYAESEDNITCVQNKVYDPCAISVDCTNVIAHSDCVSLQCLCTSGYHASSDNSTCNQNKIGDECDLQSDCTNVMSHSECVDGLCACTYLYRPYTDNTRCITYIVGNACENTTQCSFGVTDSNYTNSDPVYIECDQVECSNNCNAESNTVCAQSTGGAQCTCVCKAGFSGSPCQACAAGEYKSYSGDTVCSQCPSGSKTTATGSTECQCNDQPMAWNWESRTCEDEKSGTCPTIYTVDVACSSSCTHDSDCIGTSKCCAVSECSGSQCIDPKPSGWDQCVYKNTIFQVGETFSPQDSPCINCNCERDKTFGNPLYGYAECDILDCPHNSDCDESEQVLPRDSCCPVCQGNCDQMPVEIPECPNSTYSRVFELGEQQFGIDISLPEFSGKDNCAEARDVIVNQPENRVYTWQKTPYMLNATARAVGLSGGEDTYVCRITVTILDKTPPTVVCPLGLVYYETDDCVYVTQPEVSDNVCGQAGFQPCRVDMNSEACGTYAVGSHSVSFTVTDEAGNEASCSYDFTVKPVPVTCNIPPLDYGRMDCTGTTCEVKCDNRYSTFLLDELVYECTSSWSPALPDNLQHTACTESKPLQLIGIVVASLPCPIYDKDLIQLGLQFKIQSSAYAENPDLVEEPSDIKVDVNASGCNEDSTDTDQKLSVLIELRDEYSSSDAERITQNLRNVLNAIQSDITNGNLLTWPNAPSGVVDTQVTSSEPTEQCGDGQKRLEGGAGCVDCPTGTYHDTEDNQCELCRKHTYNDQKRSTVCFPCPVDSITLVEGASRIEYCETQHTTTDDQTSSSVGVIVGACIAVVVIIAVIIIAVLLYLRMRSPNSQSKYGNENYENPAYEQETNFHEPNDGAEYTTLDDKDMNKGNNNESLYDLPTDTEGVYAN